MRKSFMILILSQLINSYKLLPNLLCQLPKSFEPCKGLNQRLITVVKDVFTDLRYCGIPIFLDKSNNSICAEDYAHYGQMIYDPTKPTSKTDLLFKNSIIYTPITAYNIVLHEALHSLGLDHTTEYGMMSYSVSENWFGSIINDDRKLWISVDDIRGISKNCF